MPDIQLTPQQVSAVYKFCQIHSSELRDGKPIDGDMVVVPGITSSQHNFNNIRLEKQKEEIISMLSQLPKKFRKDQGGGWSFLNMCTLEDGTLWTGMHIIMEMLVCLGIAIEKAGYCLSDRDLWQAFPGGMPYIWIDLES